MFLVSTRCCVLAMKVKTQIFKDNALAVTGWLKTLDPQAKKYNKKTKTKIRRQKKNRT